MRLENDLIYEFLDLADELVRRPSGRATDQNARRRRAVSTAYYAVFHALSFVCADTLSGPDRDPEIVELLYRALDHAELDRALKGPDLVRLVPSSIGLAEAFKTLQQRRYQADYAGPDLEIGAAEAIDLISIGRRAVTFLENSDTLQRRRLAVLLAATARPRQTRR